MASTRQLKGRVKSVKSTRQITKAMQLVAASKMRKAQEASQRVQLFSQAARELLTYLRSLPEADINKLYAERPVKTRLVIIITGDRGLSGAYNSSILKMYTELLKKDRAAGVTTHTIAIGRKGSQFVGRIKNLQVDGVYENYPDHPTENDLRPIIATAVKRFEAGEIDAVDVLYTQFKNSVIQIATEQRLLPAGFQEEEVSEAVRQSSFEPTSEEVLEAATVRLIEAQLLQFLLDSTASKYSMQMIAMKNATDNAGDIIDDLTLEINKVRQAAITQELAEISGGVEAMNG